MKYFHLIAFSIFLAIHLFTYFGLFNRIFNSNIKYIFAAFVCVNFIFSMCFLFFRFNASMPNFIYYILACSVGFTLIFLFITILYQILLLPSYFTLFFSTNLNVDSIESRREFLRNCAGAISLCVGLIMGAWGLIGGALNPKVENVKLSLNLSSPLRFVQISDLHIGGLISQEKVKNLVQKVNEINPDFIILSGDILDTDVDSILPSINELKGFNAPTFFASGNHEFYHGIFSCINALKNIGIIVLENDNFIFNKNGKNILNILGVNDITGAKISTLRNNEAIESNLDSIKNLAPNLEKALLNTDKNLPNILIAHQPKFSHNLKEENNIDLVLSGHTHGGQIFPFTLLVKMEQKYVSGLYELNPRTKIYVNSGAGFWGPPMRIGTRAEITLFEVN